MLQGSDRTLRARMMKDTHIRGMKEPSQKAPDLKVRDSDRMLTHVLPPFRRIAALSPVWQLTVSS